MFFQKIFHNLFIGDIPSSVPVFCYLLSTIRWQKEMQMKKDIPD
jgi:hypothetical protein